TMPSIFSYQSAEVDWCEGNFERSAVIAEYYNTVTTVSTTVHVLPSRAPQASRALLTELPLLPAGLFSTYFHMTLSYVGQLLDELSILWTLAVAYSFWLPKTYFPRCIKSRYDPEGHCVAGSEGRVGTMTSMVAILRSIALAVSCRCNDKRVHRMAAVMVLWWVLAISSWISDRWLCGLWQALSFPYLHSFWHVLIAISLLYCFPLVIYFDVRNEMPSFKPKLGYWPSDSWPIVVPYINMEEPLKQC
ncbi:ACER1 ceramidase, partial [Columbina picui]|nr:ACER1 ceramidase [Columbina picui]